MPEFHVQWSFSEIFEAEDEHAALDVMHERIRAFTEPDRFHRVKRSVTWQIEAVPGLGEGGHQDPA